MKASPRSGTRASRALGETPSPRQGQPGTPASSLERTLAEEEQTEDEKERDRAQERPHRT
jgi:hypothetical protein